MINLTSTISVPNITRWKVMDFTIRDEDTVPSIDVTIQILGTGGVKYAQYTLSARSDGTAARLVDGTEIYTARWLYRSSESVVGAYTALLAAYQGAANLAAQKQALALALISTGLVPSSMAGT